MANHHKSPWLRLHQRSTELPIKTELFTLEKLNACLKSLKNSKTPGPDNAPAEVWKTEALSAELFNVLDLFLHKNQNGFRPGRSPIKKMLFLR